MLFISGREVDYMRNRVLLNAARSHFDVTVLTTDARNTPRRMISSLRRFVARRPEYDVCLAGFYGQPIAIALSLLQDKPVILDAYVSTYDTLCEDRRWFHPRSLMGRVAYWLDRRSCQVATSIITDTKAQAGYFIETFAVPADKITAIYVGCDETLFYPREETKINRKHFEVFYYGAFLPLHGTETIVRAAYLLRDRPEIQFTLGGDGPRRRTIEGLIDDLGLTNVTLTGWIPTEQLPAYIARASICLGGHFSTIPKAARVISTKTFQFIAMQKATIVGKNAATRELLNPGEHVCAVPMGNPEALADTICVLADDDRLRQRIALGGYKVFQRHLGTDSIADHLASVVARSLR